MVNPVRECLRRFWSRVKGLGRRAGIRLCYGPVETCVTRRSATRLEEAGEERLGFERRFWTAAPRMSPGIHAGT